MYHITVLILDAAMKWQLDTDIPLDHLDTLDNFQMISLSMNHSTIGDGYKCQSWWHNAW